MIANPFFSGKVRLGKARNEATQPPKFSSEGALAICFSRFHSFIKNLAILSANPLIVSPIQRCAFLLTSVNCSADCIRLRLYPNPSKVQFLIN
jgi:hypothetical protein